MPTDESAFVAKINDQIELLRNKENGYAPLLVYVSGIATAWKFGREYEFNFEGDEVLIVRQRPTADWNSEGVPEIAFPIRHIVATELEREE